MHGDFSKWPLDLDNVVGPLHQQGRVLLDTQQNAATSAVRHWQDETARAAFGHNLAAVPSWERDAFKVERAEVKPDAGGNSQVFVTVDPGFMWADGILAQIRADANAQSASRIATYLGPPLEAVPTDPAAAGTRDAVVLEVWRAALSGFQDPNLLEPALGGPDTHELLQTQMAFRLFRMGPNDTCDSIRDRIQDDFSTRGRLSVTLAPTTVTPGDCPTVQGGGYSGFEHDLYRIEVAELPAQQPPMFKWSQFNGGLVGTGIFDATPTPPTLTVIGNKPAIATSGLTDCYVESFEFDPQLGRWKLVYAAPATLGNDDTISLKPATFGAIPGGAQPRFFRLWNGLRPVSDFPATASPPVELRDGIRLAFDAASGLPNYLPYDYWTFAVRAGDLGNPQTLVDNAPPIGVHHHRVPIAELHWTGGAPITAPTKIDDCRVSFPPLTANQCCCTLTVGAQGDFATIHEAVAALPDEGGRICVLPGEYTDNVLLQDRTNVIISGCGPHTIVRSNPPKGETSSADPVFHVLGGLNVRIESLTIVADDTGIGVLLEDDEGDQTSDGMPLQDVTLQFLDVTAALGCAIEMDSGTVARIRDCNVVMKDVDGSQFPGIMVAGSYITIERNRVGVRTAEIVLERVMALGEAKRLSPFDLSSVDTASSALGGIWLRGGCRFVRVLGNQIVAGIGNGITLGSAELFVIQERLPRPGVIGWIYGTDQCGSCDPGGTYVPPGGGPPGGGTFVAGPPLTDIVIEGNSISNMGLNGIGVFAFFGDPANQGIITVRLLRIAGNQIFDCLSRQLADTPDQSQGQAGYGGIALADVEHATITNNLIAENGPDHLQPICGIFMVHAVNVEICENLIFDNGRLTTQSSAGARPGPRGGIWVTLAAEPMDVVGDPKKSVGGAVPFGVPALRVRGNRVEAPLGRGLTVYAAAGPVSVVDNRFCSRGITTTWDGLGTGTIWILDLAIDRELTLATSKVSILGIATGKTPVFAEDVSAKSDVNVTNDAAVSNLAAAAVVLPADGNVMFADNQVALEISGSLPLQLASITIVTLDDLAFDGNQCDAFFRGQGGVVTNLLAITVSMRCQNNRFKDNQVLLSALNIGFYGSITTGNEATHCLFVEAGKPQWRIKNSNIELLLGGACDKLNAAMFTHLGGH